MGVESPALPTIPLSNRRARLESHATAFLVGLAYFALARLGLGLASLHPSATPIWPPTGLAIAAILLWGNRIAPAIFIGAFLINQLTAGSIFTSLAIASGNTLEPVIAGYLARHWAEGEHVFDTATGVVKFALISLAATSISATIGVSSLTLASYADASSFIPIWLTWWLGDFSGALVVAPVVVLWLKSEPASLTPPQLIGTGLTYLAAVAVGVMVFSPVLQQTVVRDALGFLVILPLLWAALRQGPRDTATVVLVISAFAVWGTLMHGGPFAKLSLNNSFILLLAFIISAAVLSLALSADVAARNRIESQQRQRALETEVLWQATVQAAFGGSFEDLIRGCLERICRVTGWPIGHVYLPDDVNNPSRLLSSPVWHFEREELAALSHEKAGAELVLGEGLPGSVWASKTPEWVPDISRPHDLIRLRPRKQTLLKYGLRAAFGFPLYSQGKLQAVLEFFSTTAQAPDKHLLYVVQSIGEQLGRVLERNRGQEQERRAVATADALTLTKIRSNALEAILNALTSAVYLTDRYGQIVYMNRAAEHQVGTCSAICVTHNRLTVIDRTARLLFAKAIDKAIDYEADLPSTGFTIALPGAGDAGLIATVVPFTRGERQSTSGLAAIFMQDPTVLPPCSGAAFAKLYGLTKSELRVLLAMLPGLGVKQVAEELGIGESTVKTHLQHIYSKTGTSKQTELLRLFMSFTPPVEGA